MVNTNKLKGKIVECEMSIELLSKKIGIDKATIYRKLKADGKNFTIREAGLIAKELGLTLDEVNAIFFSQYVAFDAK